MQPSRVGIWLDPSKALIKTGGMFKWHDILNEQQMWILACLALCLFLFPCFLNQFLLSGKSAFLQQLLGCFIVHMLFPGPGKNSVCYEWNAKHQFWISQSLEAWVKLLPLILLFSCYQGLSLLTTLLASVPINLNSATHNSSLNVRGEMG